MNRLEKEKEFEEAIENNGKIITKICYYFSGDSEEFKDLKQEVLCNIWKGWDRFGGNSKLSTWIYRISINTCISFQRKERKSKSNVSLDNIMDLSDEPESNKLEKYKMMHNLIKQLKYEDRAIILMWLDEKSYDEIAELTGITRNTIAVKLKRIKEKLIRMSENR